jgi:hypothetical protein
MLGSGRPVEHLLLSPSNVPEIEPPKLSGGGKLISSMSRRGNCRDNAVTESFFQLLKRERIRRQIYATRDAAKADVFNYIEMFYNPKRRHGTAGDTSPVEFERRHSQRLKSVQGIRGDSLLRTNTATETAHPAPPCAAHSSGPAPTRVAAGAPARRRI